MKSFRMEKVSGDQDVTHEGLMWLVVLALVLVPAVVVFALFANSFFAYFFSG